MTFSFPWVCAPPGRATAGSGELTYTRPPSGIDWKVGLGRGIGEAMFRRSRFSICINTAVPVLAEVQDANENGWPTSPPPWRSVASVYTFAGGGPRLFAAHRRRHVVIKHYCTTTATVARIQGAPHDGREFDNCGLTLSTDRQRTDGYNNPEKPKTLPPDDLIRCFIVFHVQQLFRRNPTYYVFKLNLIDFSP